MIFFPACQRGRLGIYNVWGGSGMVSVCVFEGGGWGLQEKWSGEENEGRFPMICFLVCDSSDDKKF